MEISTILDQIDLGAMAPIDPACGFGFSEPPRRPTITLVRPLLHDPSGQLDEVLASLGSGASGASSS